MDGDWITVAVGAGAVVLGLLLLWIAVRVFGQALATAVDLFAWKAEHGFVGVALHATVRRAGLTILYQTEKNQDRPVQAHNILVIEASDALPNAPLGNRGDLVHHKS